jgi:alkylation response protein AidB-like acyl-CoA dehydrogenase
MDFGLTSEQEMLRRTARDVLADCASIEHVRAMIADPAALGDREWRRMAELGWQGLLFSGEYGGSALGMVELAIVLEEMGRVVLPGPFIATILAGLAIAAGGSPEQRARWLPGICDGSRRATIALLESSGRWDAAGVQARAVRDGDALLLGGTKLFVPDAAHADLIVCAVRRADDGLLTLVVLSRDVPGLAIRPLASIDHTRRVAAVTLDGVRVPAADVLPCDGDAVLARLLDQGRVAFAADMCGGAARVLELTVEYAKVRRQFGRTIGSFQAIQHRCADMLVEVEKAKAATYYAAWADSAGEPDAPLAAANAKAIASDAYRTVAAAAIQVHGGIGFTWEHDLQLYFKRAQSGAATFGDGTWNRELVAQRLGL